jgi:hypothetical protein
MAVGGCKMFEAQLRATKRVPGTWQDSHPSTLQVRFQFSNSSNYFELSIISECSESLRQESEAYYQMSHSTNTIHTFRDCSELKDLLSCQRSLACQVGLYQFQRSNDGMQLESHCAGFIHHRVLFGPPNYQ